MSIHFDQNFIKMITKARVVKVKYNVLMSRRTSNIFAMGDVNCVSDNRLDLALQSIYVLRNSGNIHIHIGRCISFIAYVLGLRTIGKYF